MLDIRDMTDNSGGNWRVKLYESLTSAERNYISQAEALSKLTPSIKETLLEIYARGFVRIKVCSKQQSLAYAQLIFPEYKVEVEISDDEKSLLYHSFLKMKENLRESIARRKIIVQEQERKILERIKKDFEN